MQVKVTGPCRLLRRRKCGVRGHQLDAAPRDRRARLLPPRAHLPEPDLLGASARSGPAAEAVVRGLGYLLAEVRRRHQRPDRRDPPRPRVRSGNRLCAAPHGAVPGGATPHRGQARGHAGRARSRRPCRPRIGRNGRRGASVSSFASVNSISGLGPIGAMGVAVAAAAMLTLLPGLLLVGGRRAFWPYVPRYGSTLGASEASGKGSAHGSSAATGSSGWDPRPRSPCWRWAL